MLTLIKHLQLIAADLNSVSPEEGSLNTDFKRLSFYLNNLWIVKIMNFLQLTYFMRSEVQTCNSKLQQKADEFKRILERYKSNKVVGRDLDILIQYLNSQLDILTKLNEDIEKIFKFKSYKVFGNFETTNRFVLDIIKTTYDLIRILKKENKKVSVSTSQLAKATAAHSISTLTKIINGS